MNGFSELSFDINLSVDLSAFSLHAAIMFGVNKGEDKNLKSKVEIWEKKLYIIFIFS